MVHYDDGSTFSVQGQVLVSETVTTSDVEFKDGKRKAYPLHVAEVRVIIRDVAHDVMEGRVEP